MSDKYRDECPEGCKVFVGNLDREVSRDRIVRIFNEFGRVRDVWLATNPPGFGFIMYDHRSAARQAVKTMHNRRVGTRCVTVELATGHKRHCFDHRRRHSRSASRERGSHRTDDRRSHLSRSRRSPPPSPPNRRRHRTPPETDRRSRSLSDNSEDGHRRYDRKRNDRNYTHR